MQCIAYNDGILFYREGDILKANYQQFIVFLRDCEKGLNGHILINYSRSDHDIKDAAGERRTNSNAGDEDEAKGCGIGFFLRTDEMDYLYDEAFGIKIYTTTETLANDVKFGLRCFMDAVCIFCPGISFDKLLPFAPQILQILQTLPQMRPILPTVAELNERKVKKEQYSKFTVSIISRFHHYFRGPRETNYVTKDPMSVVPWNETQETLDQDMRAEWMATYSGDAKWKLQPTMEKLAAAAWLRQNYEIQPSNTIEKRVVFQSFMDAHPQANMRDAEFGKIMRMVFTDIQSILGGGRTNKPSFYANLSKK